MILIAITPCYVPWRLKYGERRISSNAVNLAVDAKPDAVVDLSDFQVGTGLIWTELQMRQALAMFNLSLTVYKPIWIASRSSL